MVVARRLLLIAVTAAVLVGGWQLASQNAQPVVVHYGWGTTSETPLWVVLTAAFATGALLVSLYTLYRALRAGLTARRYRIALQGLEAEVHQLRNLPLAAEERAEDRIGPALDGGETPVG